MHAHAGRRAAQKPILSWRMGEREEENWGGELKARAPGDGASTVRESCDGEDKSRRRAFERSGEVPSGTGTEISRELSAFCPAAPPALRESDDHHYVDARLPTIPVCHVSRISTLFPSARAARLQVPFAASRGPAFEKQSAPARRALLLSYTPQTTTPSVCVVRAPRPVEWNEDTCAWEDGERREQRGLGAFSGYNDLTVDEDKHVARAFDASHCASISRLATGRNANRPCEHLQFCRFCEAVDVVGAFAPSSYSYSRHLALVDVTLLQLAFVDPGGS
ncbi:hypothetical protein C8R45DRAFT_1206555 [Mycena sanguinolenta]|nr:hypothetical protein C8R45DRAFT_1206555 [Mycena sanguinolenta]